MGVVFGAIGGRIVQSQMLLGVYLRILAWLEHALCIHRNERGYTRDVSMHDMKRSALIIPSRPLGAYVHTMHA